MYIFATSFLFTFLNLVLILISFINSEIFAISLQFIET